MVLTNSMNFFIRVVLTEAGFEVNRADDLGNSRNIMANVIRGIAECNLIIADLTEPNPNVYYELGLAHSLNKPAILLTQEVESLPFDLRSYSVVPYTNDYRDIDRARTELRNMAAGLVTGTTKFGSPISDFLGHSIEMLSIPSADAAADNHPGILDNLAEMEEGWERINESIQTIHGELDQLNGMTVNATQELNDLNSRRRTDTNASRRMRMVLMRLGHGLSERANNLSYQNDKYNTDLEQLRTPLESIMHAQTAQTPEETEQLAQSLSELDILEDSIKSAIEATTTMTGSLSALPALQRTFDRSRGRLVTQCQRLIGNFEQTLSIVARVKEIGYRKLN